MTTPGDQRGTFAPREVKAFKWYVVEIVLVAAGLFLVAPTGSGRVVGALLAIALLPVPPLVIYVYRKWRVAR